MEYCLVYEKTGCDNVGFVDADFANDENDRKSYTGWVFKLGNCAVSWESKKQATVALSSAESEYMSLGEACKEAKYLKRLLSELVGFNNHIGINVDNKSALDLASNPVYHSRTKHIDVMHHFVREIVKKGIVNLQYLCTEEMIADIFTKSLLAVKHKKFVLILGLHCAR
jgi:hypothetical protein